MRAVWPAPLRRARQAAMTDSDDKLKPAQAAAAARAKRLAEELRANLRKRKEKARAAGARDPASSAKTPERRGG